jgi:hypothetical protein
VATTDAPVAPQLGLIARIFAGVAGGLAGGVVFGILMQVTGVIPYVALLIGRESLLAGWAVHMSIAAFVGITYALLFGWFAVVLSISTLMGAFYGVVWWVLGGLTLMPLRLGMGLFVFDAAAWQSLVGHIAYGLTLGAAYALAAHMLAGAGQRGRHAAASAGVGGSTSAQWRPQVDDRLSTWAEIDRRGSSRVRPMSAEARSLRARHQRRQSQ